MNNEINNQLDSLLNDAIDPLKIAFYFSAGDFDFFHLILSKNYESPVPNPTMYDIPSLVRTLGGQRKIFSQDLLADLYEDDPDSLCFIIEWSDHARKIMIFNLENLNHLDEGRLSELLTQLKEQLHTIFQLSFHQWQQRNIP